MHHYIPLQAVVRFIMDFLELFYEIFEGHLWNILLGTKKLIEAVIVEVWYLQESVFELWPWVCQQDLFLLDWGHLDNWSHCSFYLGVWSRSEPHGYLRGLRNAALPAFIPRGRGHVVPKILLKELRAPAWLKWGRFLSFLKESIWRVRIVTEEFELDVAWDRAHYIITVNLLIFDGRDVRDCIELDLVIDTNKFIWLDPFCQHLGSFIYQFKIAIGHHHPGWGLLNLIILLKLRLLPRDLRV